MTQSRPRCSSFRSFALGGALCTAILSSACGNGCGCGGDDAAPTIPEASTVDRFSPTTAGATADGGADGTTAVRALPPLTDAGSETAAPEPVAEPQTAPAAAPPSAGRPTGLQQALQRQQRTIESVGGVLQAPANRLAPELSRPAALQHLVNEGVNGTVDLTP